MAKRKPKLLDAGELAEYAARLLGLRAYSISELRLRLRRRAAQEGDVEPLISRLKQAGLVDDRRFAEGFATARRDSRGFGKGRVLRDLAGRRVAPQVARRAVEEAYAGADERQMIEDFLARKYRGKRLPEFLAEEKNLMSAYRKLRYAGFSSGASISVLKQYAAAAVELESLGEEGVQE